MNALAADPFAPESLTPVRLDVYTAAYRISGSYATRFRRVAEILNQMTAPHIVLSQATVSEYDDPQGTLGAHQVFVALDEILMCIAATDPEPNPAMQIPKRPVKAQIAIPPLRVTGTVHVPQGSRPADGILNVSERFLPVTDVTITCASHPELGRTASAVAVRRSLAHVILIADDERPDELLADVLDERTAQHWLSSREANREPAPEG